MHAAEQDRPDVAAAREAWRRKQPKLDPRRLVFIDETAVSTSMTRFYGRAPRGRRLVCKVPFGAWKTMTFIAALRHDRFTAPMVIEGPMSGQSFLAYVDQVLVPTLKRGDILIMDNVPTHKVRSAQQVLNRHGVLVPEFPPYSPDLNPIEQAFAKLKAFLRKTGARSLPRLSAAIRACLKNFSPAECAAYLAHAGYGQPYRQML